MSWIGTGASNPGNVETNGIVTSSGTGQGFVANGSSSSYTAKLNMHGTDNDLILRSYYSGSGKRRLLFQQQDSSGVSNRACIDTNGDFGIGTTSPDGQVHLYRSGGDAYYKFTADSGGVEGSIGMGTDGIMKLENHLASGPMVFRTGGSERARITNGGNIGIGTTDPGSNKLRVEGDARIQGNLVVSNVLTALISSSLASITATQINCAGSSSLGTTSAASFTGTNLTGGSTDAYIDSLGKIVRQPSDKRLKKNIKRIKRPLDKIKKLRGVTFQWKPEANLGETDYGMVAQEVAKIVPELVCRPKKGLMSVKYSHMVALLVEAIKEQQELIEKLDKKIAVLIRGK